jgi:3-deoxy-D-manno-octulosonic-acid transferase
MVDAWQAARAQAPGLRLVLVPRHHERAPAITTMLATADVPYILLSAFREGEPPPADAVLVANTTGEMMTFLAASDVVFVGKSLLDNHGGHNIIEPAVLGKPIIFGTHMENFRVVASIFRDADAAIEVRDGAELTAACVRLINDNDARSQLAAASRRVVEENRGAVDHTLDLLTSLVARQ